MLAPTYGSARRGFGHALVFIAVVAGLTAAVSTSASAQGTVPDKRVAIDLVGGYQTSVSTFSQTVTFEAYSETGSLTATYSTSGRPVADPGVVVRVWRNLGFGVAASWLSDSGSAEVVAQVPNPLVVGQPREVSGAADVQHKETTLHLQATYWAQLSPRIELTVSGGPSIFWVDQDFVSDVTYTQTYPYTTATYQGAATVRQSETVTGGNIGGEVGWRLTDHLSLAGLIRYSHATATFAGTGAQAVPVGGLHVGGGIRISL